MTDARWAHGPQGTQYLTEPLSPDVMRQFRATRFAPTNYTVVAAFGGAIFGLIAGLMMRNGAAFVVMLLIGGLLGGVIGSVAYTSKLNRNARLWAFAGANGFMFHGDDTTKRPGMVFDVGGSRRTSGLITTPGPNPVEFANYQYTTGSGKSQQTHRWGFMALHLDNLLPNIVLDAEGNNGLFGSNLPVSFSRDQRLSLEGDFDKYFRLYCPTGYERDALYLFTPDIMVRFMDSAAELDVEIVDSTVFFYAKRDLVTIDPHTWAWLFSVINAFIDKVRQWERWRDDRLAMNQNPPTVTAADVAAERAAMEQAHVIDATGQAMGGVAPAMFAQAVQQAPTGSRPPNSFLGQKGVAREGQRLRRGAGVGTVVAVVFVIVYAFIQIMTVMR